MRVAKGIYMATNAHNSTEHSHEHTIHSQGHASIEEGSRAWQRHFARVIHTPTARLTIRHTKPACNVQSRA